MILPVEHFYTITHVKHILLIQFIYARSFPGQRTVSLAGNRADILQNIVSTTFRELKLFLPNWFEFIKISADDLERL